jgi:hypothetical protein
MALKNNKKDPRYQTVQIVLQSDKVIKQFKDIFKIIPKSIVSKDMHTNNNRMQNLIDYPGNFTFEEIAEIAGLIGCEYGRLRDLVEKAAGLVEVKSGKKQKTKQN